jgi:integrase/recombinase XerC
MSKHPHSIDQDLVDFYRWLELNHRPLTAKAYYRAIVHFCHWLTEESGEHVRPVDLTIRDGVRYRDYLQQLIPTRAPATINAALAALTAWGDWVVTTGERLDNPFTALKRIDDASTDIAPQALADKEQAALLRAARCSRHPIRDEAIITLCLQTGVRVGEICGLCWGNISMDERSGWLRVEGGKGNKYRQVPLSITARRILWRWATNQYGLAHEETPSKRESWSQQHADILRSWIAANIAVPVFTSQKGGGIRPRTVQQLISQIASHAKLTGVTPHTLRHTFATDLVNKGVAITIVSQLLGHSSLASTYIYTKPNRQELSSAVERLRWE